MNSEEYPVGHTYTYESLWRYIIVSILLSGVVATLAIAGGIWLGSKISSFEIEGDDGAPISMRVVDSLP